VTRPFLLLTIVPAIAEYREIARGIMSAEWFVRQNDKVHGPFDAATVKRLRLCRPHKHQLRVFLPVTRKAMPLKPWSLARQRLQKHSHGALSRRGGCLLCC